ncbi:MAG: histone deacetylase family protein [Dehalococcoidia bacterium]|nr:histone deacetylase family protein [Dehalococcoidia bacterium]
MKIVFHEDYRQVYSLDPASRKGRLDGIVEELKGYDFIQPKPAREEDLLLVHSRTLVDSVKKEENIFPVASLAAGGAIRAARIAMTEPAFGLIRPPGHHAGRDFNGGFCYFNNMAIAVAGLLEDGLIEKALIVDIDLHYGNGTSDVLGNDGRVIFLNMVCDQDRESYLVRLKKMLASASGYDIIGVSAGFDTYEKDWGRCLKTTDYKAIGRMIKEAAAGCGGRRFALLEGGYYFPDLGENVRTFLRGLE